MSHQGLLFLFANDLWWLYCNNRRCHKNPMMVTITRIK
jgi:hypothetical protein